MMVISFYFPSSINPFLFSLFRYRPDIFLIGPAQSTLNVPPKQRTGKSYEQSETNTIILYYRERNSPVASRQSAIRDKAVCCMQHS